MKERPIRFHGVEVRAILGGSKTQTRRTIKCTDCWPCDFDKERQIWEFERPSRHRHWAGCHYGQPGDRLWVRETWQPHPDAGVRFPEGKISSDAVCYAADLSADDVKESRPWKPSIHMPRWASRILLEITGIRVERLQEISEADAKAEGAEWKGPWMFSAPNQHIEQFRLLWTSLNGPDSWDKNPWVWVIEFKRLTP